MAEAPRTADDLRFARTVAETLLSSTRPRLSGLLQLGPTPDTLSEIARHVADYTGRPPNFLPPSQHRSLARATDRIEHIHDLGEQGGVLLIHAFTSDFALPLTVDIFNENARRALEMLARAEPAPRHPTDNPEPQVAPPPYTPGWAHTLRDRGAPVEFASPQQARFGFLTLLTDALRLAATAPATATSAPPASGFPFTANCNLPGWALEYLPQFAYTPTRFGAVPTWPVPGTLPTSGNYYFQGLNGAALRTDPTPHYASPSSNATLVNL